MNKLFTFLDFDNVPWNNNNAEHAIKHFATYRRITNGNFTELGISQYLILLSIHQTCKYKGKNLLTIGRFEPSSKTCSFCGNIYYELSRDEKEWTCKKCKTHHDRDTNAAINIKNFALIKSLGKDFGKRKQT